MGYLGTLQHLHTRSAFSIENVRFGEMLRGFTAGSVGESHPTRFCSRLLVRQLVEILKWLARVGRLARDVGGCARQLGVIEFERSSPKEVFVWRFSR